MTATEPKNPPPPSNDNEDSDSDPDALFASLENEDDSGYRQQRIEQLNAEYASAKVSAPASSDPSCTANTTTLISNETYPTLTTDSSILAFTTQSHRCVIHFAHPDFSRCAVMDQHLETLAREHYEVRFARVDVRYAPFVVEKLSIRVLPVVIGFRDGVGVERVVGFEGLGAGGKDGGDRFSLTVLEKRLLWKGVLVREKISGRGGEGEAESESESEDEGRKIGRGLRQGNIRANRDEDEDDDWD